MAPTRPVTGQAVATAWGQDVHDRIYLTEGDISGSGTASGSLTGTWAKLDIGDGIPGSPGGWLDESNDRMICPTGKGGLYLVTGQLNFISAAAGFAYRFIVYKNGATQNISGSAPTCGGSGVAAPISGTIHLDAGDYLEVFASVAGTTGGTATLTEIRIARIGDADPS